MRSAATAARKWKVLLSARRGIKAPFPPSTYKKLIQRILSLRPFAGLPAEFSEVSILFCGDEEIRVLNRDYRKKNKPTDVLSFPQEEAWSKGLSSPSLGDLVISVDTAARQAKRFRITLQREVIRLTVHGLLHLAGYDHEKVPAREAQRMRRAERAVMSRLTGR